MSKTIKLSAIFTATVLVAGLIGVSFSDDAFAKKPDTKDILIHVKDVEGNPAVGALCSTYVGFNFDFVPVNKGGVVKLTVPADQELVNITCIDQIDLELGMPPFLAQWNEQNIPLKENGTTVLQATLVPI